MAMIFTLSTMLEERLSEYVAAVRAAEKKPEKKAESYNEIRVTNSVVLWSLMISSFCIEI
jgi:hypothetical protein